jgi:nitrogen fixation protein NifU and related proteins
MTARANSRDVPSDCEKIGKELKASTMQDGKGGYSEEVIERWLNPKNLGKVKRADGIATMRGPCGDTMQMSFNVEDGKLSRVRFVTDGCVSGIAAGDVVAELAQGKKIEEAAEISQEMILDALNGLPEKSVHCALLAANTLKHAIKNFLRCEKKVY